MYDITVIWRAFPLHPDVPDQGMTLAELFRKKEIPVDVDRAMAAMKKTADSYGVPWGGRRMAFNSRPAQEVGLWAQERGRGHAFHQSVFQAYFVRGDNIARPEVLLDLIKKSGLDPAEGETVIRDRSYAGAVDRDWHLCRKKGVMAAPTFIIGLEKQVGAQPFARLERMVKNAGAALK